jgi:hypothetical protein
MPEDQIVTCGFAWSPILRQLIIALACLGAGAGIAMTAERLYPTAPNCMARDVKLVTLIEQRSADVAPDQLADAVLKMMRARTACHDGRTAEALAIYDSVLMGPRFARAAD